VRVCACAYRAYVLATCVYLRECMHACGKKRAQLDACSQVYVMCMCMCICVCRYAERACTVAQCARVRLCSQSTPCAHTPMQSFVRYDRKLLCIACACSLCVSMPSFAREIERDREREREGGSETRRLERETKGRHEQSKATC
jgi:hypothetical protein